MPNNICEACGSPGYLYARHNFYQCRAMNPEKPFCAEAWAVKPNDNAENMEFTVEIPGSFSVTGPVMRVEPISITNEELGILAEKHPPPQEWFDGDEEGLVE